MMYNNAFVAALKVNGKILKEFNDTIYIPFQSEYSILLKNLNISKKVLVNISIDDNEILSNGLVLSPNQEIELERSIINGNLNEGNRFKFIERTESIETHRGIKLEDGLIKIIFNFEKFYSYKTFYVPSTNIWSHYVHNNNYEITCSAQVQNSNNIKIANINNIGITVPGSYSDQKFQTTSSFALEDEKHIIIFKLLGQSNDKLVDKPILVKTKQKCITCGRINKISSKFCSNCGTALKIY